MDVHSTAIKTTTEEQHRWNHFSRIFFLMIKKWTANQAYTDVKELENIIAYMQHKPTRIIHRTLLSVSMEANSQVSLSYYVRCERKNNNIYELFFFLFSCAASWLFKCI